MGENMEDNLGMGLFDSESEIELDFSETSAVPEVQKDLEEAIDDPDAVAVGSVETKQNKPSDDPIEGQEIVAKEGEGTDGGESDDKISPNLYNSLAATLKEQGLLSQTEIEKIEDVDGLVSAFKKEIKSSEYADLTDVQREYLDAIRDGITPEAFATHKESESNLGGITEEAITSDEGLRKAILQQDLVNQGLSQERALKLAERSIENGTDVEDALEALPSIKAFEEETYNKQREQVKADKATADTKAEKSKEDLRKAILDADILFETYKPTGNFKEAVYKDMTTVVNYHEGKPENQLMQYRRENPIDYDAAIYNLFSLTNGFKDLNKFSEKGASTAVTELEKAIRSTKFSQSSGQPSFLEDPDSYSSEIGDELFFGDD